MAKSSKATKTKIIKKGARKLQIHKIKGIFKAILSLPKNLYKFLKSVLVELKLVEWLGRKQTAKWTIAIILTVVAFGGLIVLLDAIFFELRKLLFNKL